MKFVVLLMYFMKWIITYISSVNIILVVFYCDKSINMFDDIINIKLFPH
jgi:hypothetical protein